MALSKPQQTFSSVMNAISSSLRHLIDEVKGLPLLILEYFDNNLLIESEIQKLQSSEIKHVAKVVLQALAALHEKGIVHTGGCKISTIKLRHLLTH